MKYVYRTLGLCLILLWTCLVLVPLGILAVLLSNAVSLIDTVNLFSSPNELVIDVQKWQGLKFSRRDAQKTRDYFVDVFNATSPFNRL